jgi:methylated-DNA-[protein]-cysteine S-methyltransferase
MATARCRSLNDCRPTLLQGQQDKTPPQGRSEPRLGVSSNLIFTGCTAAHDEKLAGWSDMKFNTSMVQTLCPTPWGDLTLVASPSGLAGAWFENQRHLPAALAEQLAGQSAIWPEQATNPILQEAVKQLTDYFAGQKNSFDLPLDLSAGSAFQQAVWQALLSIPRGSTTSYGALSLRIGRPSAVRAVGGAIGRNPLSIVVPCHRVIGSTGALTGYAGGLARKTALLQLEGIL